MILAMIEEIKVDRRLKKLERELAGLKGHRK